MSALSLEDGRRLFGESPHDYASARPLYSDNVYDVLSRRCGGLRGAAVLEIGPGTGQATRRLLDSGVQRLLAVEADANFHKYLTANFSDTTLKVMHGPFEGVEVQDGNFDLGIAATSFHWLDQQAALAKVYRLLKRGGHWAMWWMHFGSGGERDPFQVATGRLFLDVPRSPGIGKNGVPFALDHEERLRDLDRAGFTELSTERWRSTYRYKTSELVNLYRTFSSVRSLTYERRERLLEGLASVADREFGGEVDRVFLTAFYMARRPPDGTDF